MNKTTHRIRFRLHRQCWTKGQSSTSRLTVKLDENFNILNVRDIAVHSSHGWGPWNSGKKLKSDLGHAWEVGTPGHGGIIVITQNKLPDLFHVEQNLTCVYTEMWGWTANWESRYESLVAEGNKVVEIYVYDFEEDCDWAIPVLLDPKIAAGAGADTVNPKNAEKMKVFAEGSITRWKSPEICEFFGLKPAENNYYLEKHPEVLGKKG